ncbi:MAG: PIN domain-containing protein [Verrucomicrobia bacterium]|nr:PIN domain-containing protein [Verrucomicrobiota bacterium]
MSLIILLDAGPLGMVTNPKSSPENEACKNWLANLVSKGVEVVVPEIADYEVRRELLRAGKDRGLGRLDALKGMLNYAPITTPVMLKAAEFWATARRLGRQSADDASLDADMILAAQAGAIARNGGDAVIATTNVRHLASFSSARIWRDIG